MTLKTLADVRTLLRLPEDHRARSTWRYVAQQLAEAAIGAVSPADAGHIAGSGADVGERRVPSNVSQRRFPPPWTIDEANNARFIVHDATGQARLNNLSLRARFREVKSGNH